MEREYLRRPGQGPTSYRRESAEERIRRLREEKRRSRRQERRQKRSTITGPLQALFRLIMILLAFYLLVSTLTATVRAATFKGDSSWHENSVTPANLDQLQPYLDETASHQAPVPPEIAALSAALYDPDTGQFLYEKEADRQLPNASTTKMLTGILTLENCSLQDQVTISRRAATTPEQSIWLKEGETLTVEDLLYALMLRSANDAAVALAEHVSGSVEAFADLMNRKAAEIGATGTHFVNPNGLDAPGHHTTAHDLALIGAYCMRNEDFRRIVATDSYALPPSPGNQWERISDNHNKLLDIYPYADGIKTGYTVPAGKCLVGSAEKDGRRLISVILNGGEGYFQDSARLLEYGFEEFVRVVYARQGDGFFRMKVGRLPQSETEAVAAEDLQLTVRKDLLKEALAGTLRCRRWVDYPLGKGQEVGEISAAAGQYRARVGLVSGESVPSPSGLKRMWSFLSALLTFGFLAAAVAGRGNDPW